MPASTPSPRLAPFTPPRPLPRPPQVFTGTPGKYVDLKNTIADFKGVLDGKYDDLPEMAFYMVRCAAPCHAVLCALCGCAAACCVRPPVQPAVRRGVLPTPPACPAPFLPPYQNGDIKEVMEKADRMAAEIAGK